SSPIILDLDGDGVETTAATAGAYFDHAGDGFAERSGWVGGGDGLLVWDRNGNGAIDDGGELFGSETRLTAGPNAGSKAANGFAALKELDGNGDGRVDALDAAFADLRVWKDADGDGLSQAGELFTLSEAGVQSLATAYTQSSTVDAHGNAHKQIGSYTRTDGSQAVATDVWFATDTAYSIATDWRDVGDDIAALPDLAGSGTVRDLRQALARDTAGHLKTAVAAFAAEPDEGRRHVLAREIVLRWTGVDGIDPASRGRYVDGRELAAQERLTGQNFHQPGWGANPGSTAGNRLTESFAGLVATFQAQLEAQTVYADFYRHAGLAWRAEDGALRLDLTGAADAIQARITRGDADALAVLDGFARNLATLGYADAAGWNDLAARLAPSVPQAAELLRVARLATGLGTDAADDLNGGAGDDRLLGFGGDDVLAGKSGNDVLEGGAGNDRIDGGAGNDTLLGGAGDDLLNGGSGSDTYVFERGFGHDTIRQYDSAADSLDRARFTDLAAEAVGEVARLGDDLTLDFGSEGLLTVSGYFDSAARRVDAFEFADGASWDVQAIKARTVTRGTAEADTLYGYNGVGNRILGLAGDDRLHGGDADDTLRGDEGNDRLYGKSGDDILAGGIGDDVVQGGLGSDIYLFDRGDGIDTWIENDATAGNVDIARFGPDISFDQLWFGRSGNSLEARIIGTEDKTLIQNWYSSGANRIERFEAGGRTLLDSKVDLLVQAMAAFAPPAAGQTTLPDSYRQALAPVLAANWQ
ncbi:MAG: calcium-binding protein, partial [Pseudomonadota bacterium]|nr:calcium-binding protein [Pseudomonadota bacterium]MDP1903950.1 calcium-binding protein [Pseudomonadota bacterium]